MSQAVPAAADVVVAYLAAGDRGDWEQLAACLAEDVVTHSPGGTTTSGIDAQKASWAAAHAGLEDLRHEVQSVLTSADAAALRVVVTGIHTGPFLGVAPTGAALRVDQALFARLRLGRIAEIWEIVDTGAGLQQLGVLGDVPLTPGSR